MSAALLTTDLHLTARERDEYRWELFPWLTQMSEEDEAGCDTLFILGDLTDQKDEHPSKLVNRIIDTLLGLPFSQIFVLSGNHDYTDAQCPFFRFLGNPELGSKITFICKPTRIPTTAFGNLLFLPHTRTPFDDWNDLALIDNSVDTIFCHQTFDGADSGKGIRLNGGISAKFFSAQLGFRGSVFSGDIHVPQVCGDVTYVGCPYPVAFGDSFRPRVLRLFDGKQSSLYPPAIRKLSLDLNDVENLVDHDPQVGDQLKIRIHLPRSEFGVWETHRLRLMEIAEECGARVHSVDLSELEAEVEITSGKAVRQQLRSSMATPKEVLRAFCRARGFDPMVVEAGERLLEKGAS